MQSELNARCGVPSFPYSPTPSLHPSTTPSPSAVHWLLNFTRAMQQELAELTDSVPWKWWAKYQTVDLQNARVEVVDLFHFLISAAQVLGMSADDLFQSYVGKNQVNHHRQDTGYTTKDPNDSRHL